MIGNNCLVENPGWWWVVVGGVGWWVVVVVETIVWLRILGIRSAAREDAGHETTLTFSRKADEKRCDLAEKEWI